MERIDGEYLAAFENPRTFDESTVRKKLKEYVSEGLLSAGKKGKNVFYSRKPDTKLDCADALDFFSEVAPCGVIGSFLLDQMRERKGHFAFKHHYITQTLDSEILCGLFTAMGEKRKVTLLAGDEQKKPVQAVPLRIFISVQNGRQYLMAYECAHNRIRAFRLDYISQVKTGDICEEFDMLRSRLETMREHMWGVSPLRGGSAPEHVEFTLRYEEGEEYILRRLEREKRCGTVKKIDEHTCLFSADVYDANEMLPWIRTFICRITSLQCSNRRVENQFKSDLEAMYRLYGGDSGDF